MRNWLFLLVLLPLLSVRDRQQDDAERLLRESLAAAGLDLDLEQGLLALPARVLVRNDLLEYLLVGPRGATHESLFLTEVRPSILNAALLALGLEPGTNSRIEDHDDGAVVLPPAGDGVYLYVAWREGEETYLFRVEDLLSNLATGRAMRRHRWVFLGSRFAAPGPEEPEAFVADLEENLVNIAFFFQGNTLLTAALEECVEQTIWAANAWLVPPRDQEVRLVFARERLQRLPAAWADRLPEVVPQPADEPQESDGR